MAEQGQDSRIKPAARKAVPKAKQEAPATGANAGAVSNGKQAGSKLAPQSDRSAVRTVDLGEPTGLTAALRRLLRCTPSWLSSMLVHVVALLALGLMTLPSLAPEEIGKLISNVAAEQSSIEDLSNNNVLDSGSPTGNPESTSTTEAVVSNSFATISNDVSSPFNDPNPAPPNPVAGLDVGKGRGDFLAPAGKGGLGSGTGISGRGATAAQKQRLGATDASLAAVAKALAWLAEHQMPDGSWSFDHRLSRNCGGKCGNPGTFKDQRFASTGLALMSFLGAGQTHKEGKYKQNIYNGLGWLVKNMNAQTGQMYRPGEAMYAHGIATIALCEACGMANDKALLGPSRKAIGFILAAQDPVGGGWRYEPRQPGDTSVVGWQLMALKSAKFAYIKIPPQTALGVNNFLNSVQAESGAKYGYADPAGAQPTTTAIGLLCRMYLGWKKDNAALARGVQFLDQTGFSPNNVYYNYYAAQVMRQWEGAEWDKWNKIMQDALVAKQMQNGHETGSWFFPGGLGSDVGGRHYTTCMNCMTLEVPYRYLPIYQAKATESDFDE
jgi:hypothetical protein